MNIPSKRKGTDEDDSILSESYENMGKDEVTASKTLRILRQTDLVI